ncbi:MAG: hypothetical protein HC940_07845 [Acaryochloris sp. SU_5_25]|nr:hypothetical protein [Acaryochloris sp. SU_5_25]
MIWIPAGNVTRHTDSLIAPDMDFFADPPPEIGTIISADSSLNSSSESKRIQSRIRSCLWEGIYGAAIGGLVALAVELPLLGSLIGVAIAVILVLLSTRYAYHCSYVGERGIALSYLKGHRSAQPQTRIFCFQDGKNLYTQQTRSYYNGIYTGTTFNYRWTRLSTPDFKLEGAHRSEKGNPPPENLWHFADAAEGAWSVHLLQLVDQQLDQLGYVEFPIKSSLNAVRIGSGFMEFEEKNGTRQRVDVADMKDIRLGSGVFQFKHKGTTWWSGKGKYSFAYSNLPNARLFLICLDRLTGIHW